MTTPPGQHLVQRVTGKDINLLQIMEQHGVRADDITRIVREVIPAMVDDSLEGPDCAE